MEKSTECWLKPLLISEQEKSTVLEDFRNKINSWCETNAKIYNIPENQMCQIAIEVFGDVLSERWIRDCIDSKYKISYKSHNAQQQKANTSKMARIAKFAKSLGFDVIEKMQDSSQPFYESIVIVTKEDTKQ